MSGLLPAAVYGLEVPCGDVMIPAVPDFPASFRITMAAIDPTAAPEYSGNVDDGQKPRATLKLIREPIDPEIDSDDDDDDSDADNLDAILNGADSDDDDDDDEEDSDDDDDEEMNGGPSDPSKSKKARQEAAMASLKKALADGGEDGMALDGAKANKGKARATDLDEDSSSDDDSEELDLDEFVVCTLDPDSHYQQPLDITVGEDEHVFFKVTGTHTIYLTGNYVIPVDDGPRGMYDPMEEEDEYDLSPDEDELLDDEDEESDELDDIDDPRVTELVSDEEAPKLVLKGKNKRRASDGSDEEGATLDSIISKSLKPEANGEKPSKKQQKKLKNNAGAAVATATKVEAESPSGKKVSFAKNLEQGPTGSQITAEKKMNGTTVEKATLKDDKSKPANKKDDKSKGSSTSVSTVKGVKIDVRKPGSGPAAKKGSRVSMRYIGKTTADNKQFDANKSGKPFTFKLGTGEVIQGWEIGLEGICAGGERRITIPAHLAYGKKAMPGIPANSELSFDVKCMEVN